MRIELAVRDLLLATWPVAVEAVARALPQGLEPAPVDGRHVATIASFRVERGRAGRTPAPPFSQLNLRVYTEWEGEPAVFFLLTSVTGGGLPGVFLGAPYRAARIRVRPGRLVARGLGVSVSYRPDGSGEPGALGRHELGLFRRPGGLGSFRIVRGAAEWKRAEVEEPVTADLLVARGLDPTGPPDLLYSERASFSADRPARIVSTKSS